MKTVLFVCSGNTCRSPMAEAIFNDLIDEHPRLRGSEIKANSAGTMAIEDADLNEKAETALENMGIKLPKHRSCQFSVELADEADLILVMEEQHLEEIGALAPNCEEKAHTLKGYAKGVLGFTGGEFYNIEDPYREPQEVYDECAAEIKSCIMQILDKF